MALSEWQKSWDKGRSARTLYEIQNTVGKVKNSGRNRREQVIMSRLRTGHTRLNSSLNLVGKHPDGKCRWCQERETADHVILKCRKYEEERNQLKADLMKIGIRSSTYGEIMVGAGSEEGRKVLFVFLEKTGIIKRI